MTLAASRVSGSRLAASVATLATVAIAALSCSSCGGGDVDADANPTQPTPAVDPMKPVPALAPVRAPQGLGNVAYGHVEALVKMGPRFTGSPGWRAAIDYIVAESARLGLPHRVDAWHDDTEQLDFENVVVTIPGKLPGKIVIGAHHDTKNTTGHDDPAHNFHFVGANDSGSGVGLLLALAGALKNRDNLATIELVFFDGEESIPYVWDIDRALFGSRHYVASYQQRRKSDPTEPVIGAFVLLDMVGSVDLSIDDETTSDRRLRRVIRRAAEATGHEQFFFQNEMRVTDDHYPFLDVGIPAVDLIDIADNPQWHTIDDTLEHISADSLRIVGEVVLTALPEFEQSYVAEARPAADSK